MKIRWFSYIRTTGLLLVLLYHFFVKWFPGGFVGVDIFFTFSGYLITALLIDEYTRHSTIDLPAFFRRRFYRIFPPLVLTILVTVPLALLIRNDFIASIGNQITAALGFVTNFFEILSGNSYENQFTPHLFVHTWSLAIEVHFYILWAFAVWGMTKVSKSIGQLRGLVFLSSSAVFLLSFLSMFVMSFFVTEYSGIYFSSWTHIFPFFLGAALATVAGIQNTTSSFRKRSVQLPLKQLFLAAGGAFVVLLLLLFFLPFNSIFTYLFGFLLSSSAAAVLIYVARILHERLPDIEEPAVITYLSNISYGVYLFHWPFFIIFSQLFGNLVSAILTTVFSVILATFSFYILEPYLSGRDGKLFGVTISLKPYTKWVVSIATLFILATAGISLFAPKIGAFELDMLGNGLNQADTQMQQTMAFAEKGKASSFEVTEGTNIIGDSVTLRAITQLQELLPGALIDAQESRNTEQAYEILQTDIDNGTLLKDVVITTGVNTINNYEEELNNIVSTLPNGHHLILLTPYNGNTAQDSQSISELQTQYVKTLAEQYDFITIADWNAVAKANPQIWAGTDYVHFGSDSATINEGATLFAQTIQSALETAQSTPVKNQGTDTTTTSSSSQ